MVVSVRNMEDSCLGCVFTLAVLFVIAAFVKFLFIW